METPGNHRRRVREAERGETLLCLSLRSRWQHAPTKMATRIPLILCSTTFSISGLGPLDMTVRALAWVTDRTVAALNQGTPKIDEIPPMVTRRSRSKWKPDPFIIFRSGLLTIRLRFHAKKGRKRERERRERFFHTLGLVRAVIAVLPVPLTW